MHALPVTFGGVLVIDRTLPEREAVLRSGVQLHPMRLVLAGEEFPDPLQGLIRYPVITFGECQIELALDPVGY